MNKIITENHICTFCDSTEKPRQKGEFIYCPQCEMPQFEGVEFKPEASVAAEKKCFFCKVKVKPVLPIRMFPEEIGFEANIILGIARFVNARILPMKIL